MDAIQAAVLRVKLGHVEEWNRKRRERAVIYGRLLAEAGLLPSRGASPVRLLENSPEGHHVFHQYVIRASRRDELRQFLAERRIGTEIYYPVPFHLQPCFAGLGYRRGVFPHAERAAADSLALPIYAELTSDQQATVVASVAAFARPGSGVPR